MAESKMRIDSLERRRQKYLLRLSKLHEITKKINDSITNKVSPLSADIDGFTSRYKLLENDFKLFDSLSDEIGDLNATLPADQQIDVISSYSKYEQMYFDVQSTSRSLMFTQPTFSASVNEPISNSATTATTSSEPAFVPCRLPKIEIEPFDGTIEKWPNFFALYTTLIHKNKSYSKIEKFTHLRSLLRSHALSLVETLPITNNNYLIAYETLTSRFQNVRLLGANAINKILTFRQMPTKSHAAMCKFIDVFSTNVNALKGLEIPDLFDFLVMQIALRTLPEDLRLEFENRYSSDLTPQFPDLVKFIQDQIRISELAPDVHHKTSENKNKLIEKPHNKTYQSSKTSLMTTTDGINPRNSSKCPKCNGLHKLFSCLEFRKLELAERFAFVKRNNLCYGCLGFHHRSECRSTATCNECRAVNHHTFLHSPPPKNLTQKIPDSNSQNPLQPADVSNMACSVNTPDTRRKVLLSTATIFIKDKNGIPRPVKAIIDSGSQISLISESCVQRLGLPRSRSTLGILGVAHSQPLSIRGIVTCAITSSQSSKEILSTNARILPHISTPQPNFFVDEKVARQFKHLKLADPTFYKRSAVDFLLGADLYSSILQEPFEVIKGEPSAINTIFGWVIGGPLASATLDDSPCAMLTCCEQLDCSIKKFWEMEEVSSPRPEDPDDLFCEKHFLETHTRDDSGRFEVSLPFQTAWVSLPNTRRYTEKCLLSLERRLKRQPEIYEEYRRYMDEFIELGHMSPIRQPVDYVIPHHCVIKESSTTTKVRTVFNASFRPDSASTSSNDVLLRGPKLQKDIGEILSHFRLGSVVVCCDLRQMYRQVNVHVDERKYQHLFYRPQPDGEIVEYELNTLVFGVKPSAFLAQRTLVQLVRDEDQPYPLASDAIINQTFVDNVCQSVDSVENAIILQQELIHLFGLGGFTLRKWASNRQEILDRVPVDHREHALVVRESDDDESIKILGLQYEPSDDCFSYSVSPTAQVSTKRGLSSQIARIYDPLGWLTPVVFAAMSLMQLTWQRGIGWDDPLPADIDHQWQRFHNQLHLLSHIKLPRHMSLDDPNASRQLIGFCDASTLGYAAVIYARVETPQYVKMFLLTAKSKLAPLKTVSVPRLELCGAVLLSRLLQSLESLQRRVDFSSIHFFTDSSTVLSWIKTPPHKLKTFVANRVVQILEFTHPRCWAHVSIKQNPSDFASRGITADAFVDLDIWWKGPNFVYQPIDSWDFPSVVYEGEEAVSEHKKCAEQSLHASVQEKNDLIIIMERFSNLTRLQRTIAFVLRSVVNFKARRSARRIAVVPLTPSELRNALDVCVKVTQRFYYHQEIKKLENNLNVSPKLMKLSPFLDEQGFLRVGGRLRRSSLPYAMKHPLVLPRESHLAALLCDYYHKISLHGGPRLIQSLLQRKFWIVSARQFLRQRVHKCLVCYKLKAKPMEPLMSDLPAVRIQDCRPFLNTGIDFAGPLVVKESHHRKSPRTKGYIVLFVCMATKAVHLEFASSLSTPCFLAALDRFVARRGLCSQIFSDCGTNFKGAAAHFEEVIRFLRSIENDVADHLSTRSIKWNFNSPAAPHQGGLWESGVKSAKHHLTRIVGPLVLTFEEICTLLTRIEATLNSRPLGAVSSDPNDETDYLTPGHFLVGTPLLAPPEVSIEIPIENLRDRYEILQKAAQCFWKRWSKDYLLTLIPREKWITPHRNVEVGEVVYVQTPNSTPLQWPIARVVEVYPGQDGTVRNVKVRTSHGTYIRPVQKLIALPMVNDRPSI